MKNDADNSLLEEKEVLKARLKKIEELESEEPSCERNKSEEEQELFWNGKQFVPEVEKAKLFSSSREMQIYAKRLGLSRETYPELLPVWKKQMKNAA